MPAIHHIDHKTKLIVTRWEGIARDFELIGAIKKYQNEIQNHPDYIHYNEIVDFRKMSSNQVTIEGIKEIARIAAEGDRSGSDRKLAFVVNSKLTFGLAKMYETYRKYARKNTNKEIGVFKNEKDAFDWVQK
jgi:hypothetical protein